MSKSKENDNNTEQGNITTQTEMDGGVPSHPESKTDNLESIADDLISTMPDVQQHAIDQEDADNNSNSYPDLVDSDGAPFDPAIHRTDKDGNPVTSTRGKLVKKPGRKNGAKAARAGAGSIVNTTAKPDAEKLKIQNARVAGVAMANSLITLGVVLGGDEWRPMHDEKMGIDERGGLEESFGAYCVAKGIDDFPPGLALVMSITAYIAPRFTMPKTKERVTSSGNFIKKWWINRKLKKHDLEVIKRGSKENKKTDPSDINPRASGGGA